MIPVIYHKEALSLGQNIVLYWLKHQLPENHKLMSRFSITQARQARFRLHNKFRIFSKSNCLHDYEHSTRDPLECLSEVYSILHYINLFTDTPTIKLFACADADILLRQE